MSATGLSSTGFYPHAMLVTGGCGFIGANFIHYMAQMYPGLHIVNIDKLTYAGSQEYLHNLPDSTDYHFIAADINDIRCVTDVLETHQIDTIVHFAAESHVDRSIVDALTFVESNVRGTLVLLDCALNVWRKRFNLNPDRCRFHHVSTDEVYGSLSKEASGFNENSGYQPNSPYAATKAASDHLVRAYIQTHRLPATLSHCSNNYGPYQHIEKLIPKTIHACLFQHEIPVYGDGQQQRDWLYVYDHCCALNKILRSALPGTNYMIGGGNELTNLALINMIIEIVAEKLQGSASSLQKLITFVVDRLGHDQRYAVDHSLLSAHLDWQPEHALITGLTKTVEHYIAYFSHDEVM
ncbi:MAG: dTDP-glucose 4,6-dehydratase [Gammaproteobacteria bacterium]